VLNMESALGVLGVLIAGMGAVSPALHDFVIGVGTGLLAAAAFVFVNGGCGK